MAPAMDSATCGWDMVSAYPRCQGRETSWLVEMEDPGSRLKCQDRMGPPWFGSPKSTYVWSTKT